MNENRLIEAIKNGSSDNIIHDIYKQINIFNRFKGHNKLLSEYLEIYGSEELLLNFNKKFYTQRDIEHLVGRAFQYGGIYDIIAERLDRDNLGISSNAYALEYYFLRHPERVNDIFYGKTPLMYSIINGRDCFDVIMKFGPDVNIVDDTGSSALFYSAGYGDYETNVLLINEGIDVRKINNDGHQAVINAIENSDNNVFKLLLLYSDVFLEDNNELTLVDYIVRKWRIDLLRIFMNYTGGEGVYDKHIMDLTNMIDEFRGTPEILMDLLDLLGEYDYKMETENLERILEMYDQQEIRDKIEKLRKN